MKVRDVSLVAVLALVAGCATPPNTADLEFESIPAGAAVFSPSGTMLGITPFSMELPLSKEQIAANVVRLGAGTAVWYSGAKTQFDFDFNLNGLTSGNVKYRIQRPVDAPGVMQDVKFAEDRSRQATADSNAGWGALADIIRQRTVQRASAAPISDPLASPTIGKPTIECVSQKIWSNQVQTTCK